MHFINWVFSLNRYDLRNKVAIITGASSGLGEQFAHAYAENGARIAIGSRNLEVLEKLAREMEKEFDTAILPIKTDVLVEEDIVHLVQKTVDEFGALDVMINNVGNYLSKPLIDQTIADWNHVINLNLTSTFIGSREAAKVMIPNQSGCIINMASIFSFGVTSFPVSSYYASKAGVVGLTKGLAVELGKYNIRVNAIAPGFFPTSQSKDAMESPEIRDSIIEPRTALPYFAELEWIRGAACFLASEDARYITGHTLAVDGGWLSF
jgi:NAD(P)-dependent dehydrogenase (short-subunit alcohol dehydrogenase family)